MHTGEQIVLVLALAFLSLGCAQGKGTPEAQPPATPSPQPTAPTPNVEERLRSLETKVAKLEIAASQEKSIFIDCTTPDFKRLETDNGFLLVLCQTASPHLDGFKVRLQVGNPLALTFHGLDFNLLWSANLFDRLLDPAKLKKKTVAVTKDFPSGVWTDVDLIVAPATLEELKNLEVSVTTNMVVMRDHR